MYIQSQIQSQTVAPKEEGSTLCEKELTVVFNGTAKTVKVFICACCGICGSDSGIDLTYHKARCRVCEKLDCPKQMVQEEVVIPRGAYYRAHQQCLDPEYKICMNAGCDMFTKQKRPDGTNICYSCQ